MNNDHLKNKRAEYFKETRLQRHLEVAEDYTELIADLIEAKGRARVCDIAREMGISHVSVIKTIHKLIRDGYLKKDEQQTILLTDQGRKMAAFSKKKHHILFEFLKNIGVEEEIAAADVEGIEHHISLKTLEALETHMKACQML
ncbi:MAG: hypothetical protein BGO14_04685 [Chlamydiales bacterium 38-26]|nr:transcriptional regulator MntR [Chlamydiales bacterium]OJV07787.1 MAG: hypothetical protein BGO14_04685 [Chlamydiales bacterium 38-26]